MKDNTRTNRLLRPSSSSVSPTVSSRGPSSWRAVRPKRVSVSRLGLLSHRQRLRTLALFYFPPESVVRAATPSGQLTFTTSSSKRRRVAAELREAGSRTGYHFLHTRSSAGGKQKSRVAAARRRHGSGIGSGILKSHIHHRSSPSLSLSPAAGGSRSNSNSNSMSPADDPPPSSSTIDNQSERSTSPGVKRSADDMGNDDSVTSQQNTTAKRSDSIPGRSSKMDVEPEAAALTKATKHDERPARHRRENSVDMIGNSDGTQDAAKDSGSQGTATDNVYPTPSSMSTYTASASEESRSYGDSSSHASHDMPSIDEQVTTVMNLMNQPPQEKERGYVVSTNWLKRVLSRSTTGPARDKVDKTATEGEIGPVDNSDLVLVTDPSTGFVDEAGQPYVPLRPGLQMGEDFEVLPEQAWNLVLKWYGLSKQSPSIVRYAHNTNVEGGVENIQYELNPPIFTILKLSSPTTPSAQALRDKNQLPVRTLASTHTPVQTWLKNAKDLANIAMPTKVRVWRILEGLSSNSGAITPAASRSQSPAPGSVVTANAGNCLVLDTNTFADLREGSQRELVEIRDQTSNEKYNGKSTLHIAGLGGDSVIVLEEQISGPGGGEWISETSKAASKLAVGGAKGLHGKVKSKSAASSRRSSPAPAIVRGRRRKDGKPRGVTGLSNLGNTCYMNSALQCVRSVEELSLYFLHDEYLNDLNPDNPLSHKGDVAKVYAALLHHIFDENGMASFSPRSFKSTIGRYGPSFSGYAQQDSQEFVLFLLDGLQEDLNRIKKKPYIEKPDSTDDMVYDKAKLEEFADRCWEIYKARNDSVITDLFAGMYKSTLHCPECDKVSIIFDPFQSLTLQLPIENLWAREIFYFALHKSPVRVDIEIDKNATIKALKELVAKKMKTDSRRIVMAEIYKQKFYRVFDNTSAIADSSIADGDNLAFFELQSIPTSYDPDKVKKPSFTSYIFSNSLNSHDDEPASFESPQADRTLVPIYNRLARPNGPKNSQKQLFGAPSFTIINRDEAFDYDAVLRKILANVATMTTRPILSEDEDQSIESFGPTEDSDIVVTNDDDAMLSDSQVKDASIEGEDGLVDVSMRDNSGSASQEEEDVDSSQPKILRRKTFIPPMLRGLFDVKVAKTNSATATGFSMIDESKDFQFMFSRVQPKGAKGKRQKKKTKRPMMVPAPAENSPATSDDELDAPAMTGPLRSNADESSSSAETKTESVSDSDSDMFSAPAPNVNRKKKAGNRHKLSRPQQRNPLNLPYIRPGEAIILDWNEESYDALFGGDPREQDGLRGSGTWEDIPRVPDPELARKRQLRLSRKKNGVTLAECLDEYGKEEILSENDAWYCPRCKEHRRASKKFELWKTPDILVMHFKRFSANRGFRDKLDVPVDFPLELDMSGRVEMPDKDKSQMYDLIAVDNHYGGLGGGHYTAFAKNFVDGNWYEYNDSHVSRKIYGNSVVTKAAYLLFYRRRSDRPLGGKYLADLTDEAYNIPAADSDSNNSDSGANTPSGEGKRLGDSSRNGSSSALTGAAAAHQAGDGGLQGGIRRSNKVTEDEDEDDDLPPYSDSLQTGEQRLHPLGSSSMDVDEDEGYGGLSTESHQPQQYPGISNLNVLADTPGWSFDRLSETHDESATQIMHGPFLSGNSQGEGDDDDNSSMKAQRSDGSEPPMSPPMNPADLDDDFLHNENNDDEMLERGRLTRGSMLPGDMDFIHKVPPQAMDDDDDDGLPVAELPAPAAGDDGAPTSMG